MPRKAPEIILTEEQKAQLEKVTRSHTAERRSVERAKIILACAEGKQNRVVPLITRCHYLGSENGEAALPKRV